MFEHIIYFLIGCFIVLIPMFIKEYRLHIEREKDEKEQFIKNITSWLRDIKDDTYEKNLENEPTGYL